MSFEINAFTYAVWSELNYLQGVYDKKDQEIERFTYSFFMSRVKEHTFLR